MSTQVPEKTEAEAAQAKSSGWPCPISDKNVNREEVKQIWKECQEESFWYRALPLSLGSMAVTGGLIYNGVWKQSKRLGPFPKLAVAGILGYAVGKASYMGTCREKFQKLGPEFSKGFGTGWGPGFGGPGHRHCNHVCQECQKAKKKEDGAAPETPTQS
ncbi:OCIA domain-containing protein 2 [Astyanax mexicanus]|uniref:OCIA domain containing 2 n=2 Tax=Astyanax mexicanus TaxID=7994 RepID=A0A3B1JXF7_ASTMX|nr:OCIA domain-containing protein 2 [Astyanax mexicanus]KAG9282775.1 OCIA domain-containing protein 2 [Astyanax mexicanus]